MVLKNFSIDGQNIGFNIGDVEIDLHNCYQFTSVNYDVALRQLTIHWNIGQGDWVAEGLPERLALKFFEVDFLQVTKKEARDFGDDDKTLDIIGFANLDMRSDNESFMQKQTSADNDLILIFLNGQTIRVNAESVELILGA